MKLGVCVGGSGEEVGRKWNEEKRGQSNPGSTASVSKCLYGNGKNKSIRWEDTRSLPKNDVSCETTESVEWARIQKDTEKEEVEKNKKNKGEPVCLSHQQQRVQAWQLPRTKGSSDAHPAVNKIQNQITLQKYRHSRSP